MGSPNYLDVVAEKDQNKRFLAGGNNLDGLHIGIE